MLLLIFPDMKLDEFFLFLRGHHRRRYCNYCGRRHLILLITLLLGLSDGFLLLSSSSTRTITCTIRTSKTRNAATTSRASSLSSFSLLLSSSSIPVDNKPSNPIEVLYESDRILIINKPAGISHHNDNNNEYDNYNNNNNNYGECLNDGDDDQSSIQQQQQQQQNLGIVNVIRQQQQQRLWGVHRLDRVTSGILVFAKDVEMASLLTRAFANGDIQKVYFGLSAKKPQIKKQGWVSGNMVRSRAKGWKLVNDNKKKERKKQEQQSSSKERIYNSKRNYAKTRFFTARWNSQFTLILFRPYTGKTHQLRVAAKSMGIALVGDPIYSDGSLSKNMTNNDDKVIGTEEEDDDDDDVRTYLHASGIYIPSLDGHDDISVWCHPPFEESLSRKWNFPKDDDHDTMDDIILRLMNKYCDVPSIVKAVIQ